ncbi:BON domain-containing protein [Caballeronia insecticola]|uniref:Transport-associated n=1 Tax=Caballeronia insecticola TaxID=758793 RepID=R4WR38_9BURK|nr:BON domain-containing protein [Caballeronia insecticola]BAN27054.1 transport-associated [Caballeronia insecticola]
MNTTRIAHFAQLTSCALVIAVSSFAHAQADGPASATAEASKAASSVSSKAEDRALRRRVLTALGKAKGMRATGITVRAKGGAVLLEGWVPEEAQIEQATRVAQGVPGVQSVRNELTLSTF